MKQIKILLLGVVILAVTCYANASVIEGNSIDGITHFTDRESDLNWVVVTEFANYSYIGVQNWITSHPEYSIATTTQLKALHESAGTDYTHNASVMGDFAHIDEGDRIISGWYDNGDDAHNVYSWMWGDAPHIWDYTPHGPASAEEYNGAWVVRTAPVPEPATMLLFGLGLLGLAGVNRRKHNENISGNLR